MGQCLKDDVAKEECENVRAWEAAGKSGGGKPCSTLLAKNFIL